MRVVFMGTPEFAVSPLEAVNAAFSVVGVYTQPDKPVGRGLDLRGSAVKIKAQALGLPVFQPEKLSAPGEFEKLAALNPDVIVIVAYGQILRRNVLDLPRLGCVNIHSSLLPRWRGAAPIQWSILGGDAETGVSTMRLVEKLDAGEVLLQSRTPIRADDTAGAVHDRLALMGSELIIPTLNGLEDGSLKGTVQDETRVTYAAKLTKEMEFLDASQDAAEILDRRVRALNPWPGTSVWVSAGAAKPERLKVRQIKLRRDISGPVNQIFERAGMVLIGTSQGSLELLSVQWDGKKTVDAAGFLNGLRGRGPRSFLFGYAQPNMSKKKKELISHQHALIAPSILSADFSKLGEEIAEVEAAGADWLHVDVMDGHFVPNLTIGPLVVEAIRPLTKLPLDCHLMVQNPENWIEPFAKAGADMITVHAESTPHLHRLLSRIRELGCKAGVSINPATPLDVLEEALMFVDLVLVMSVNPGFGGQKFIETSVSKVERLAGVRGSLPFLIEVDGGVNAENIGRLRRAGCDVFVAGSAIFAAKNRKKAIQALREGTR